MAPSDESMDHGPCCAASRAGSPQDDELSAVGPRSTEVTSGKSATPEMVRLEGGEFLMGTNDPIGFPADGVKTRMTTWGERASISGVQVEAPIEPGPWIYL
jgi:formylglycine-generating enzyme required for sulfatase activity